MLTIAPTDINIAFGTSGLKSQDKRFPNPTWHHDTDTSALFAVPGWGSMGKGRQQTWSRLFPGNTTGDWHQASEVSSVLSQGFPMESQDRSEGWTCSEVDFPPLAYHHSNHREYLAAVKEVVDAVHHQVRLYLDKVRTLPKTNSGYEDYLRRLADNHVLERRCRGCVLSDLAASEVQVEALESEVGRLKERIRIARLLLSDLDDIIKHLCLCRRARPIIQLPGGTAVLEKLVSEKIRDLRDDIEIMQNELRDIRDKRRLAARILGGKYDLLRPALLLVTLKNRLGWWKDQQRRMREAFANQQVCERAGEAARAVRGKQSETKLVVDRHIATDVQYTHV